MGLQPEKFISVNFILHLKKPLGKKSTVGEAENNWLISDFWITGEFSFSVQTLDNLVVSSRTVGVKVSPNSKQASLHFLRYSTEQNINGRGLYLKTQRLSGKKKIIAWIQTEGFSSSKVKQQKLFKVMTSTITIIITKNKL